MSVRGAAENDGFVMKVGGSFRSSSQLSRSTENARAKIACPKLVGSLYCSGSLRVKVGSMCAFNGVMRVRALVHSTRPRVCS